MERRKKVEMVGREEGQEGRKGGRGREVRKRNAGWRSSDKRSSKSRSKSKAIMVSHPRPSVHACTQQVSIPPPKHQSPDASKSSERHPDPEPSTRGPRSRSTTRSKPRSRSSAPQQFTTSHLDPDHHPPSSASASAY